MCYRLFNTVKICISELFFVSLFKGILQVVSYKNLSTAREDEEN